MSNRTRTLFAGALLTPGLAAHAQQPIDIESVRGTIWMSQYSPPSIPPLGLMENAGPYTEAPVDFVLHRAIDLASARVAVDTTGTTTRLTLEANSTFNPLILFNYARAAILCNFTVLVPTRVTATWDFAPVDTSGNSFISSIAFGNFTDPFQVSTGGLQSPLSGSVSAELEPTQFIRITSDFQTFDGIGAETATVEIVFEPILPSPDIDGDSDTDLDDILLFFSRFGGADATDADFDLDNDEDLDDILAFFAAFAAP